MIVGTTTDAKINYLPLEPPKYCTIWLHDTSISSSDHVVSDDIKIIALSYVVFK